MKKILAILLLFILLLAILFFIFWQSINFSFHTTGSEEKIFVVKRGDDVFSVGKALEQAGLIKNRNLFYAYIFLSRNQNKLKAGSYLLNPSFSLRVIADKIIKGEIVVLKVTIPEGFTVAQIEERLGGVDLPENLEGYLFPDTYEFPLGVDSETIVRVMTSNFDTKITKDIREEIARQGKSLREIVIMASILEKEVKTFEDKKIVSGILWKRLSVSMPLQVDSTITYITGKKTIRISLEDTQIDSPYNTYKYLGLPPTPISNPGIESILAAVYPKESDYWYYLSKPDGKTVFSKTLSEHNVAKSKYLK